MSFDKIRALNDREQSREKLPIFYGSRSNYYHGFRELLNNAVDEISNNFSIGNVDIILHDDCETITIRDTGRGMPIQNESNGVANWELFFCILFASGKYDSQEENAGTNGVGSTVLNYSSKLYEVNSHHNGEYWSIEFENGGVIKTPLTYKGTTDKHGTEITFKLDNECYTDTKYSYKEIDSIVNKIAAVSNSIKFTLTHKDTIKEYAYANIEEYYKSNFEYVEYFKCNEKTYDDDSEKTRISLIFSATNEDVKQESFLNRNYLPEGGSINDGVINALKLECHKYAKDNAMYNKNEKSISNSDIENSINFIVNVLSSKVEFQSQTKFSTKKELYKTVVQKYTRECVEVLQIENKDQFKNLVNSILITKRANEKAENTRKSVKKELEEKVTNSSNRPPKFVPCRSKNPKEIELILIEGDSAMNNIKLSRNPNTMCIYPLKGKPMNVLKHKIDNILKNQEIKDIFKILGCGVSYNGKQVKGLPKFDIDNLQVDKIQITTDFDVDGSHIQSLLIGLFYTLAPELIKQGKVYILYTPLYVIYSKGKEYLAYSEIERNNIVKDLTSFKETRFKGIGGLSVKILSETAMHPEKRIMKQLTIDDAEECLKSIELFLSEDDENSKNRKLYIEEHSEEYFDYSLLED